MDKLGVSAQKGIGVVMRQTLYGYSYSLVDTDMNPNPDYWLSALHRALVGRIVLNVSLVGAPITTRVYAHCTSTRHGVFPAGAVTVFGLNISPDNASELVFDHSALQQQPIDVYMLSSDDSILSKHVLLNGKQRLVLPSDTEMPKFKPVHLPPGSNVTLLPLTFGFFVFPKANVPICT
jgi:heparanase 1